MDNGVEEIILLLPLLLMLFFTHSGEEELVLVTGVPTIISRECEFTRRKLDTLCNDGEGANDADGVPTEY